MDSGMKFFKRGILVVLAGISGAVFALGSLGFWMGYQAQKNAEMMKSYKWIHNDRCRRKIVNLPDPGPVFKFAVLGDIQIGVAQLPRLMRVLEDETPVAFAVQTGDAIAHDGGPGHYKLFLNELAHSGLSLPMFVVPGNHDVSNDTEMLFEQYFGSKNLWFEYGKALFILVNNALGQLDYGQYRWMENVLKRYKVGGKHIFVFMHNPPINWKDDGVLPVEHLYEPLFELLERYNVDYVFTGDWHGYHREDRNGTVFLVNGRGGDFDADAEMVPSHCTIVEIKGDSIQDRTIELSPRRSIVLESRLKDLFIAHIGELAMENRGFTTFLLLLVGLSCVFSSFCRKK